jgi:acyl-coenzyme A thioesterase PaaI-like protein
MSFTNRMRMGLQQLQALPEAQRGAMMNSFIQNQVKFLGTTDTMIEVLEPNRAICTIANQTKVQNHIGTVHAAAMTLVAETATGMVLSMNMPDDKVQVAKSMNIKFVKMAKGALKAVATLTEEQIQLAQTTEKGEVNIAVKVTDEAGNEPIIAEIIWAWFPANRGEKPKTDDKQFLQETVNQAVKKLEADQKPVWGTASAQEMLEHLTDSVRFSYIKPWDKTREVSDKQKQYKAFFYNDQPFPRNMQNPLYKDGRPPLRNPDLEAAKADFSQQLADFMTYFDKNPEHTFFHILAGEMTFQDLMRFHAKHFAHHLQQFELI